MPTALGKFRRPVSRWVPTYEVKPFADQGARDLVHMLVHESPTNRERWRCAYLYAKQANSCEDPSARIAKYGLNFQILKWSEDELQPDQIGRKYESDGDMIRRLENSLGEKTTAKKPKKKLPRL